MRRKLGPDEIAAAHRLEADGWPQHQIAEQFGVCQATVCRALRPVYRDRTNPIAPNRGPSSRSRAKLPHPTFSDEPYTDDETEFLAALAAWQTRAGVRFPTACEYRQVLLSLGYRKVRA